MFFKLNPQKPSRIGKAKAEKTMSDFKLVENHHSFKLLVTKCCQPMSVNCQSGQVRADWSLDKFQDQLLKSTYILASCLIIYSLLLLNGLLATEENGNTNFLLVSAETVGGAVTNIWYDTIFFMDDVGSQMGNPLANTIDLYQRSLAKLFVVTGNVLSKVPQVLATPPPAKARSL